MRDNLFDNDDKETDGIILEASELVGNFFTGNLDMYDQDGNLVEEAVAVQFEVDSIDFANSLVSLLRINYDWINK